MARRIIFNEFSFRRLAAGLTQRELAKKAGVDYERVRVFEQTEGKVGGRLVQGREPRTGTKMSYEKLRRAYEELPDWRLKARVEVDVPAQVARFIQVHGFRISENRPLVVMAEDDLVRLCRILAAEVKEG